MNMRLGRLEFKISYVVDLDNPDMCERAEDILVEDIHCMDVRDILYCIDHIEEDGLTLGHIDEIIAERFFTPGGNYIPEGVNLNDLEEELEIDEKQIS